MALVLVNKKAQPKVVYTTYYPYGQNPFGNWYQANSSYWAYVLVHYDGDNYNYEYGFTFKDDAGYGLYPTKIDKIDTNKKTEQVLLSVV